MTKKIVLIFIVAAICLIFLSRCHHGSVKQKESHVVVVSANTQKNNLFYAGTIQPLKSTVVTSPVDGVIDEIAFNYGDKVTLNKLLFKIDSTKFSADYKTALTQYLKSKNEFDNSQSQLNEGKFLFDNQLISLDDYRARQNSFYSAQLAFFQAKGALAELIKQINMKDFDFEKLSISNIDKVNKVLDMNKTLNKLSILATTSGVALIPTKNDDVGGSSKKLDKGDQVKQGDVLALIAEPDGIGIRININEFDINQLQIGQAVRVTGPAFPNIILQGTLTGIDHQAQANQNGMPAFTATVSVPHLTAEQHTIIHIGMTAKVEIEIVEKEQIIIPLEAIKLRDGKPYIQKYDVGTKKYVETLVLTGKTTENSVEILSNLSSGDKIVFAN